MPVLESLVKSERKWKTYWVVRGQGARDPWVRCLAAASWLCISAARMATQSTDRIAGPVELARFGVQAGNYKSITGSAVGYKPHSTNCFPRNLDCWNRQLRVQCPEKRVVSPEYAVMTIFPPHEERCQQKEYLDHPTAAIQGAGCGI